MILPKGQDPKTQNSFPGPRDNGASLVNYLLTEYLLEATATASLHGSTGGSKKSFVQTTRLRTPRHAMPCGIAGGERRVQRSRIVDLSGLTSASSD